MQTRIVAYDALGARRGVVPNPLEVSVTTGHNDLGVVALHYNRLLPKSDLLDNAPEIAVEVFINNAWVEIKNTRCKWLTTEFDHLEEVPTRRYDFIGVGEGLKGALVYGAYGLSLNDDGKVQFKDSNVGRIIKTVWDNAVSRGWSGFTYDFTATADSNGQPWSSTFTVSYAMETNLAGILGSLVAMGLVDFDWDGRKLSLYNANTFLGRDLTVGANPVRFASTGGAAGIDSAPETQDVGELATHVIVLGETGHRWEFPTGTIVPEGRREIVLSYAGIDDIGSATIVAAPTILKAQNHRLNTTRQFHLTSASTLLPFVSYRTGDWANVQRGIAFEKMRIFSLNLQINENGTQGYVTLGDKIDDLLNTLYSRVQSFSAGVGSVGVGTPTPPQGRTPTAPTGLSVTSSAFIGDIGQTLGTVTIAFAHDGKDTKGETISVKDYPMYYRPTGTTYWAPLMTLTTKTGAFSPLRVYNDNGDPMVYDFKVQARSWEDFVSADSNIATVTMAEDVDAPPTPTTPTVSTWLRTVTVKWDGKGKSPSNVTIDMPADYNLTKVWQATASDMTGKVLVGTFTRETPFWQSGTLTAGTTYWYALSALDASGNESALSPSVSVTPVATVDIQEITDKITGTILDNNSVNYQKILGSEEMWTKVLGAHLIKAGEIDVNNLIADTAWIGALRAGVIIATAIDGMTITGATLQTLAAALRGVKLNTAGIQAYDAVGNKTFDLDAATGNVTATGIFQTQATGRRVKIWDHGSSIASMDMFPDTTDQHGAIFSELVGGNYQTSLRHFTSGSSWSTGLFFQSDGTFILGNSAGDREIRILAANKAMLFSGPMAGNAGAYANGMFEYGDTGQTAVAAGTWTQTFGFPAPSGKKRILITPDGVAPVSWILQNQTNSGFKIVYSGPASNSTSFSWVGIWTL